MFAQVPRKNARRSSRLFAFSSSRRSARVCVSGRMRFAKMRKYDSNFPASTTPRASRGEAAS